MLQVIDRRLNGRHKSAVNRQRFIRRYKEQIREAVSDAIAGRSITDTQTGEKISIPSRDISEPVFRHGRGGSREAVHPGNTEYVSGDKIKHPPPVDNGGSGDQASEDGIGSDDFAFEISREEFMEIFFEDLELPNMDKTQIDRTIEHDSVRAGHTINGVPSNIDIVRSMRGSMTRRMALQAPLKRTLRDRQAELIALLALEFQNANEVAQLEDDIAQLKRRIAAVPFIDEFDLR
ncbi:MAG: uncharacterized sporulation protein YeaH/YhbH (DUF444 family) [Gammaproteobacteria bacterium]|jgi:uncharacterized sporulation protein YeaH/YhbH (DUF444 family)